MKHHLCIWYIYILLLLQFTYFALTAKLRLYCGSLTNFTAEPLEDPISLLQSKCFNASQKTIIYAFGFTQNPDGNDTHIIVKTYSALGTYNVFVIDWTKEASTPSGTLDPIAYATSAVPNTEKVGRICGQTVHKLSLSTLNLTTLHLIGHSLGAHLMGYCGQELQKYQENASRISGLDPAGPMYDGLISLNGLTPSSAAFVDVWHTNPGVFGSNEQIGQVDLWFNCNKKSQPACVNETLLNKIYCNHDIVTNYYSEAVLNSTSFVGEYSNDCGTWVTSCQPKYEKVLDVGETINRQARGNYFYSTNAFSPFGRGLQGLQPI